MGMKTFKKIRESMGLNPWQMAKILDKGISTYQALEKTTSNPNLADLIAMRDLAVDELKWSDDRVWDELRKDVKKRK